MDTLYKVHCAGCGCELAPYEVFSSRLRGLKKPVCIGCALDALVFLLDELMPMCDAALGKFIPEK